MCCEFYETSLCFVTAHFAAHQERVEDRNSNFAEIIEGIRIGRKNIDILNQFHHIFWFGDLNYRIDLHREEVLAYLLLDKQVQQKLHDSDQLTREMQKQAVFSGFNEGPIKFNPTYKYEIGNREYAEQKSRVPSWCDRVLWKSLPGTYRIHQTNYSCSDSIMTSDHSPVYATFQLKARLPIYALFLRHTLPVSEQCIIMIYELQGANLVPRESNDPSKGPPKRNGSFLQLRDGRNRSHSLHQEASDPFLEITAPFLVLPCVRTGVIYKTVNPAWSGAISLRPAVGARSYLEHQHLHVRVIDQQNGTELGQCALPLNGAFEENSPAPFVLPVLRFGRPCGTVSGKVHVLYSK